VEFELSKIDAAVEQLDWAIRLLIDHKAYVPAIALAAAAEAGFAFVIEKGAAPQASLQQVQPHDILHRQCSNDCDTDYGRNSSKPMGHTAHAVKGLPDRAPNNAHASPNLPNKKHRQRGINYDR
jgi:hypothetical protein